MMFDDEEENNRDDFTCISILLRDYYFLYSFFFLLKPVKRDPFLCVFDKHATDAGGRVALDYFTNRGGRGVSVFAKFLNALSRFVRWNRREHTAGGLWIE